MKPWYGYKRPFQNLLSAQSVWGDNEEEHEHLGEDRPHSPTNPLPHGAGLLEKLPLEIGNQILLDLDLESLDAMRRTSVTCRDLIDDLPQMEQLNSFASDTLKVLDMVNVRSQFALRRVYAEFCHPWCRFCGDFGCLVFIPTFTRCCRECHETENWLEIAPLKVLATIFKITEGELAHIPFVDSFPSGFDEIGPPGQRVRLIRIKDAQHRAIRIHEKENWARVPNRVFPAQPGMAPNLGGWKFKGSTMFPYKSPHAKKAQTGSYCRACELFFKRIPSSVSTGPQAAYWYEWRRKSRRGYLDEEKDKHLAACKPYQQGYLQMGSNISLPARAPQPIQLSPSPVEIPKISKRAKVKRFFQRVHDYFIMPPGLREAILSLFK